MRVLSTVRLFTVLSLGLGAAACRPSSQGVQGDCQSDSECRPGKPYCDRNTNTCTECVVDEHCSCHDVCQEGVCKALGATDSTQATNAHGNWQGAPGSPRYTSTGACANDDDCDFGEVCNPLTAGCIAAADYNENCVHATDICRPGPNGEALACAVEKKKCLPAPVCVTAHNCCNTDAFACDTGGGICRAIRQECTPPAEIGTTCPFEPKVTNACSGGLFCAPWGECVDCLCDGDCLTSERCYAATKRCVPADYCTQSSECNQPLESCDTIADACRPYCASDDECDERSYCNRDSVCRARSEMLCQPDEYDEPGNNTAALALENGSTLPLPAMGEDSSVYDLTICGPTAGRPADVDWYALPLVRGDAITFSGATTTGLFADMTVYAADATTRLAMGSISPFSQVAASFTVNNDAIYFLEIKRSSSVGNDAPSGGYYDLTLARRPGVACDDPFEEAVGYNNVPENATPLAPAPSGCTQVGNTVNCSSVLRMCPGDGDFYLATVPPGGSVAAEISRFAGNLDLFLYGPFAEPEDAVASGAFLVAASQQSTTRELVSKVSREGGLYLVQVLKLSADATNYDMQVAITPPGTCVEDRFDDATAATGGVAPAPTLVDDAPGLNDTGATASTVALAINATTTLAASSGANLTLCRGDTDYVRLAVDASGSLNNLPTGHRLTADLRIANDSPSRTATLAIVNGEGALVSGSRSISQPASAATIGLTDGGAYYLIVAGSIDALARVDYTVDVFLEAPAICLDDELGDFAGDRNDAPATALVLDSSVWPVAVGDKHATSSSTLTLCATDRDWYRSVVPADTRLIARLRFDPRETEAGLAIFDDSIENLSDSPVATALVTGQLDKDDVAGRGFQRVVADPASTDAFIEVYNRIGWPLANYELELELVPSSCFIDLYEPNDSGATATPLVFSRSSSSSVTDIAIVDPVTICSTPGGDKERDWFSVKLLPGDRLEAKAYYEPLAGNIDLSLHNPTFTQLSKDSDPLSTGTMRVTYTLPPTGPAGNHYLQVETGWGQPSSLYYLEVKVERSCVDDDMEPSTINSPWAIELPVVDAPAVLCNDQDWYSFNLDAASDVSVCLKFVHTSGDIDLKVFPAGSTTPIGASLTKNDEEEVILTGLAAGAYKVEAFLDPVWSVNTEYTLHVYADDLGCR